MPTFTIFPKNKETRFNNSVTFRQKDSSFTKYGIHWPKSIFLWGFSNKYHFVKSIELLRIWWILVVKNFPNCFQSFESLLFHCWFFLGNWNKTKCESRFFHFLKKHRISIWKFMLLAQFTITNQSKIDECYQCRGIQKIL